MSDDAVKALEREFLAREAWFELNALLTMIPSVDPERLEALRGLSIRCIALVDLMRDTMEVCAHCDPEYMQHVVFGEDHDGYRARFEGWLRAAKEYDEAGVAIETTQEAA